MAVKPVCFAELLVKVGSANFAWLTHAWKSKQAKKKILKKSLLQLHPWATSPSLKLLEAWLPASLSIAHTEG